MNNLRIAQLADLDEIEMIIESAKVLLKKEGLSQWQSGTPNREMLKQDIAQGNSYVYFHEGYIAGVICIQFEADPNYEQIEGQWQQENEPYVTLHRVATHAYYRNEGISQKMFRAAEQIARDRGIYQIRVDTHKDNYRMNYLIKKMNYEFAGIVNVKDPLDPKRNAYQYFIEPS